MKRLILVLLVMLALAAAGCNSGQSTATQQANTDNAVSTEQKLLLGTLKLGGPDAVTKDQAAKLLPLWEGLRDLNQAMAPGGDTDTQVQIDDLAKQISAAMTANQLKAIDAMNINRDTAVSIMQELGFVVGSRQGGFPPGDGGQAPQAGFQGRGQGGQPPAGFQPRADGQAPGGGQAPGEGQRFNRAGGLGMFIPSEMYDAVIQALQQAGG